MCKCSWRQTRPAHEWMKCTSHAHAKTAGKSNYITRQQAMTSKNAKVVTAQEEGGLMHVQEGNTARRYAL